MARKKNAPLIGIASRAGLLFVALGCLQVAHAAYAQLAPPAGASTGAGGQLMYRAAANEKWLNSTVRTNAALNVGGRTVQVPLAMRFAANAPRFIARAAFVHPALLAGTLAAPYLLGWALENDLWIDNPGGTGVPQWVTGTKTMRMTWQLTYNGIVGDLMPSPGAACSSWAGKATVKNSEIESTSSSVGTVGTGSDIRCRIRQEVKYPNAPVNDFTTTFETSALAVSESEVPGDPRPVDAEEFEEKIQERPMPSQVPDELPIPLPVQQPVVNPSPGTSPQSQPFTVPLGDPRPVPNSDPQQYSQPVARVTPSPTVQDPWRVDIREQEVVSTSPEGLPDPTPIEGSPETKPEENKDFCESNPDSIACAEMDTPEGEIPREQKEVTYQAENVLGGGSCPANKTMVLRGQVITVWDWQAACQDIVRYVKPVIIAICGFIALVILVPGGRGEL